jgi:hypothetical protein
MPNNLINDDINPKKQVKYVHITENYAEFLLKILALESEEVTLAVLETELSITSAVANQIYSRMNEDSRGFLSSMDWLPTEQRAKKTVKKGAGGRPSKILEIKPDKIVTNPLSAKILMELAEISKKNREVNREEFIKQLIEKFSSNLKGGNDGLKKEISERINFLSKIGDICYDESVPNVIWIDWIRYHSQKTYLKLLAEKLSPPS